MTGDRETSVLPASSLTGVVLAGGTSTRFGPTPKATATLDGRPLVDRVVRRLWRATGRPPVVAARSAAKRELVTEAVSEPVRFTPDADWCGGPVAGLAGSLDAVETDRVFVCGCDMPLLSPAAVSWQAARLQTTEANAVVPMDVEGQPQLLHGVFDRDALASLFETRPDDDRLRVVLDRLTVDRVPQHEAPQNIPLARSTVNVNTRGDLRSIPTMEAAVGHGPDPGEHVRN
ncbi:molybdenum cofactor guanylyltransferase [Haloarchaeobius sp. DYHT-AS-18]|uniref:molybdenum cofactor guanylyltransferase n=1 Tax=Haloarchaeobius sp. DYHT-AS-18 TaxID=3446117 RepID=UPI003EB7B595